MTVTLFYRRSSTVNNITIDQSRKQRKKKGTRNKKGKNDISIVVTVKVITLSERFRTTQCPD